MILTNPGWVGYFDRTYDQIRANVLTKFGAKVPEITDHTETNPWVKGISIWSALAELLGYYIDNKGREIFLPTALQYESGIKIAKMFDYRVKGAVPASTQVRFSSNIPASGNINIPAGTIIQTPDGVFFATTANGVILTGTSFVDVPAKQWQAVININLGNSDGSVDQDYVLEEDVVDGSVVVMVDVLQYAAQDTFAFSFASDKHFIAGLAEDTKMHILFGDGLNGIIPPSGQSIVVSYYVTLGSVGNVGAGRITQINSSISVPGSEVVTVNNAFIASGGADFENLTKLKKRIPLSIRTKYRAVTPQDFIDLAEIFAGVERAGVNFNCDVDKYVHVYIAPEGGGVASQALIDDVAAYLETRKIITVKHKVEPAGVINFKLIINVQALPGFSNASILTAIQNSLLSFFNPANQEIKGHVVFGDLYDIIEENSGVDYSEIILLLPIPFARPLTNIDHALNWTPVQQVGSSLTQDWLIRFITNSTFELYRGIDFVGTFAVDTPISQTEINFTINGNHTAGDNFQFYTYDYNKSVFLAEPSIPATQLSYLTISVTGGV